jgi:hypothetical protein
LHEFGHALGFYHELQHPFEEAPWDEQKVLAKFCPPFNAEEARRNILDRLDS